MPSGRPSFAPSPKDGRGNPAAHPSAAQAHIWLSEPPLYRPLCLDPLTHRAYLNGRPIALRARGIEVPEAADHDPQRQGSWLATGARRTATHAAPQRAQKGEDHIVHTREAPASHCDHAALDAADQMTLRSIPRASLHTSRRYHADAGPITRISSASERWDDVSKLIHRVAMPPACLLHIKG